MKKRTALLARIAQLERQRQPTKQLSRRIIVAIDTMRDCDIIGMSDSTGTVHVPRRAGEALAAFERRSAEIIPRFAFRVYAARSGEPERG